MKPVFADAPQDLDFPRPITPTGRAEWLRRVEADPESFVVEDLCPLSHAPVWHQRALESRALMLRVCLLSDGSGDYHVMPGGLARIAGDDRHIVSGQRGGGS